MVMQVKWDGHAAAPTYSAYHRENAKSIFICSKLAVSPFYTEMAELFYVAFHLAKIGLRRYHKDTKKE